MRVGRRGWYWAWSVLAATTVAVDNRAYPVIPRRCPP